MAYSNHIFLQSLVLGCIFLQFPEVFSVSFGYSGFNWGWATEPQNFTKVVTSPEVLRRYPLQYPFRQCSAEMEGVMTRLHIYPCSGERCKLIRGNNVTLDLEFISNIPATSLEGSLSAIFTRWFSPLSLGEPQDLCAAEHITCPIQPFYPYRYTTSIYIRPTLPSLSPDIRVTIKAENGRDIACAIVPVTIMGLETEGRQVRGQRNSTLAI